MPIEPLEPEPRINLTEICMGLAVAVIVAPGVIWWIAKLVEIVRVTVEAFR